MRQKYNDAVQLFGMHMGHNENKYYKLNSAHYFKTMENVSILWYIVNITNTWYEILQAIKQAHITSNGTK